MYYCKDCVFFSHYTYGIGLGLGYDYCVLGKQPHVRENQIICGKFQKKNEVIT